MSTLCIHENYLRDRYVLGNPVHYAAGSSSPKPKSYDREGNEYVWSDEAGDYVRQVGGPGGGRTIRLSEVEKAEIEQPQNEQVNADSGQHGSKKEATPQSNVDYSEFADAYKRYRAEDKKVASLKRKASKIQKAVSSPSSGATPEEIQSARESLAKIRGDISDSEKVKESLSSGLNSFTKKHNVVFIDGGDSFVVNPSPELLQGLKQRKSLQDRVKKARKKSEDAKKAGLNANASTIASVADKLEGELNRVNDLLSQMFPNETVVSVVDEPKNEQTDLPPKRKNIGINSFGRYAPTSRDVEDFLRLGKSALEGKSAAVAKGIKRYLQGAGVIDSSLGLTPLGQMLKEDRLRAAPYALINLVYNDPQIRWFYERYGDGGYHQFEDVYHDLVDAGYSKNVAKELVAGYKKFVADPALDVFPVGRLVDKKTFQIESIAPFIKSEHAVYALYRFSDKFLDGRPGFRLSVLNQHPLSPFNVFQVDREGAKPLLHGATSAYPGLIYASFTHDHEKINLLRKNIGSGDVFRELTSKTETGKTDETAKEPEESSAQFDASGLGLPGKSDAALKPDVAENKDAAYFIRRDLGEEKPQDAPANENSPKETPAVEEKQAAQEQPAKPRPERWTPLKSKMNDDDRRVIENTRKRLNYGLSELAWRLGNAKEKGDVQRVKQLVATAANHYLEQARRAYRSHGGTEALAAFDEALGGDGLTVGQLRDRVVDKFRKIAQMEANDLFKFAGERLDEFESFAEADSEPIANKKIYLNSIRDKNGKWEDLDDKDNEIAVEDGKPTTLFPDEYFGRRMGSERGLADAVRRALKSMTRKGEYRDSFENGAEYADPKYNIDTPTRMGRFLAHGYKDSIDGKHVSRDDYSERRYQELLEKFPTDRESRKLDDLFKSNNREVNKLIKENEDEYKQSKNKSEVVQRVVDGIRDVLLEKRQNGSAEAPPSESLRNGTTGEVLETGGTGRLSNGGDGRNLASVIAEEAQKSDIPESRVRKELDAHRQSKISPDSQKAIQSLRNLIQRVYDHDGLAERIKSRAADVFGDTLSAPGATGFESTGEHDKHLFRLADELDKAKKKLEKAQERFDKKPDSEKLERAVDKAEDTANEIEDRLAQAVDEFVQLHGGKSKNKRSVSVAKKETSASTSTPHGNEKPDWLVALESQEDLKPVSRGKYNPNAKPYSWKAEFPETEDELREYWREHVDGGEDEEVSFGSDGERVSVGEQSGDAPMTLNELRRFVQLRHGRELRKSLGLSEHFSEKELKKLQEPDEKRGRGRPTKTPSEATQRVAREAQKSEVPKEQIQERIAEALGTPSDTSKRKRQSSPKKNFDPDSIKDDVKKAVQIRDADRSQLSVESIDSMMGIAQNVSKEHGVDGLRDFMRRIDVVPVAKSRPKLLQELRDFLEDYGLNRYKATVIRNM